MRKMYFNYKIKYWNTFGSGTDTIFININVFVPKTIWYVSNSYLPKLHVTEQFLTLFSFPIFEYDSLYKKMMMYFE